jgi:hypothetical protein
MVARINRDVLESSSESPDIRITHCRYRGRIAVRTSGSIIAKPGRGRLLLAGVTLVVGALCATVEPADAAAPRWTTTTTAAPNDRGGSGGCNAW